MQATATERDNLSPPDLARLWRVNVAKIYALIASGEIAAINLAVNPNGKPRLRIKLTEVERFEQSRSTKPPEPAPRRRRRKATPVKDYFG